MCVCVCGCGGGGGGKRVYCVCIDFLLCCALQEEPTLPLHAWDTTLRTNKAKRNPPQRDVDVSYGSFDCTGSVCSM